MSKLYRYLDRLHRVRGHRVVPEDALGLAVGHYYLKRLFANFSFDFVFDIGANNGQYARMLRTEIGYRKPILSVEPIPEIAAQLRRKAREDPSWFVHEAALDNKPGVANFHIMAGHEFSSLAIPSAKFEGKFHGQQHIKKTIQVMVENLDGLFQEQQKLHAFKLPFVKLDTQGTELRVLESASRTLEQIPALQVEVSFEAIYENAPDFAQCLAFMRERGFTLSALFPNNSGHFPHLIEMDAVFIKTELLPEFS